MTSFDARLRLVGQPGFPLGVDIDLSGDRMVLTVDGKQLADWSIEEIEVLAWADGFYIEAEGEGVVLNVSDEVTFARELGL